MAAWGKAQDQDTKIRAQEKNINAQIANNEAQMNQKARDINLKNLMYVDEFNRAADAKTKDRKLMAVQNAMQSLAGMNKDRLQYKAQKDLARAYAGQTGVMDRFEYQKGFDKLHPNLIPGTEEYNTLFNQSYNEYVAGQQTSSTGGGTTTPKAKDKKLTKIEDPNYKESKKYPGTVEYTLPDGTKSYMSPFEARYPENIQGEYLQDFPNIPSENFIPSQNEAMQNFINEGGVDPIANYHGIDVNLIRPNTSSSSNPFMRSGGKRRYFKRGGSRKSLTKMCK
jgi:hypothetical protein